MSGISSKVAASTIGSAAGTLIVWVFETYVDNDKTVPVAVAGAIITLLTFAFGFFTRERNIDTGGN